MIIGDDFFDQESLNDTANGLIDMTKLQFTNMMLDELALLNNAVEINPCEKFTWTDDTVLAGDFQGNTELGSLGTQGETVDEVLIKRRRKNGSWKTIDRFDYDFSTSGTVEYEAEDKYVEAMEEYEYAVVPSSGGNEGMYNVGQIFVEFEKAYLFDADEYYELDYDFKYGGITRENASSIVQTLGGRYPIIISNGNIDYSSGSVSCKVMIVEDNDYNKYKTKELRNKILDFLINKKPKILKSEDGMFMLINITSSPNLSFNRGANNLYDLNFSFTEIGNAKDDEVLEEYGLLGVDRVSDVKTMGAD